MPPATRASERVRIAVAITAWCGVLLQLWLSLKIAAGNGKTWPAGLVAYFGFFTVITNWFVAVLFTLPSLGWKSGLLAWLGRHSVAGCATTAILLVALVYHFLLRELWNPQGAQWLADIVMHYVVPAGVLAWWWLQSHGQTLEWSMPLRWCSYPFIYLGYVMVRGEFIDSYPYPFINVHDIGLTRALLNAAGLIAVFLVLGFGVYGIARARGQQG
ncbi:MAG TPA: Pr6Pr family membrane protein [Luteolibacter sp.]|nr:Pr6Pr family membrane protein [Luteolibacter sp.]